MTMPTIHRILATTALSLAARNRLINTCKKGYICYTLLD